MGTKAAWPWRRGEQGTAPLRLRSLMDANKRMGTAVLWSSLWRNLSRLCTLFIHVVYPCIMHTRVCMGGGNCVSVVTLHMVSIFQSSGLFLQQIS